MQKQIFDQPQHQTDQTTFQNFERIYKKIKRICIGLFLIFCLICGITLLALMIYFHSLSKTSTNMSDAELKKELLTISGNTKMKINKPILPQYDNSTNTLITGPKEVSPNVIKALTSSEDSMFFRHNGVLPKAVFRAISEDLFNSQSATGGSTITQQLVKNQVLSKERTYSRKANELVLAMRTEHLLSKKEILFTYLNIVPFGLDSHGANISGIASVSFSLFGKSAENLNVAESAYIVGLLQSPYHYTPYNKDGSLKSDQALQIGIDRQHYVLKRMLVEKQISSKTYERAKKYNIKAHLVTQ